MMRKRTGAMLVLLPVLALVLALTAVGCGSKGEARGAGEAEAIGQPEALGFHHRSPAGSGGGGDVHG